MKIQVFVRLKSGVLDVQGKAVERGLHGLGFAGVQDVRIGKLVEFELPDQSPEEAKMQVQQMCEKLLANTVIESFEVQC